MLLLLFFHVLVAHFSGVVCSRSLQLKSDQKKKYMYGGKEKVLVEIVGIFNGVYD